MKISEVMVLVNAGYTKADIEALEQSENGTERDQNAQNGAQSEKDAQGVQNTQAAQNGTQGVQNGSDEMTPGERAIISAIAQMTRTLQASNMANTSVGSNNGLSVEDSLAFGVFGNKPTGGNK